MFSIKRLFAAGSFLMLAGVVACGQIPSSSQNDGSDAREEEGQDEASDSQDDGGVDARGADVGGVDDGGTTDRGATDENTTHWIAQVSGTTATLRAVHFIDSQRGWIAGNTVNEDHSLGDGVILKTIDGGENWIVLQTGFDHLYDIFFVNERTGFVVGPDKDSPSDGFVFKTTDGGLTWTKLVTGRFPPLPLTGVHFEDENTGWVVSLASQMILKTTDGGAHWTIQIDRGVQNAAANDVCFVDANIGWTVGDNGTVLNTTDGGAHWLEQTTGAANIQLQDASCVDADTVFAVGISADGSDAILATTNGGATWTQQTSAAHGLLGVSFVDRSRGWAVGWGQEIIATTDGGTTWTAEPSGTTNGLLDVHFADANAGWAVGTNGTIMKYTSEITEVTEEPTATTLGFADAVNYATGELGDELSQIVAKDLDGDNHLDLIFTECKQDAIGIMLGRSDGTFASVQHFGVGNCPGGLAVGDINGDTILDVVAANRQGSDVSLLTGNGSGGFQAAVTMAVGLFPCGVILADMTADGVLDLAIANIGGDSIMTFQGRGDGTFVSLDSITVGDGPTHLVTDDFNSDGITDLAVSHFNSHTIGVLLGQSSGGRATGRFGTMTTTATHSVAAGLYFAQPVGMITGDYDSDGIRDIIAASESAQRGTILLGQGMTTWDGTFAVTGSPAIGDTPEDLAQADFNGDGITDFAMPSGTDDNVAIFVGNGSGGFGDGTFSLSARYDVGDRPWAVTVGDFDADGKSDVAVLNVLGDSVSVLLNTTE